MTEHRLETQLVKERLGLCIYQPCLHSSPSHHPKQVDRGCSLVTLKLWPLSFGSGMEERSRLSPEWTAHGLPCLPRNGSFYKSLCL